MATSDLETTLKPKKLDWADYPSDEEEEEDTQRPLTIAELAVKTLRNVMRTEVNPTKEGIAQSFRLDEAKATIDIMYRGQVTMVITFDKKPAAERDESETESQSDSESEQSDPEPEPEAEESKAESKAEDAEWEEVGANKKNRRSGKQLDEWAPQGFFVFRDTVNDPYMGDFVGRQDALDKAKELALAETWAHIYCPKTNVAYEFRQSCKPRMLKPDDRYKEKWHRFYDKLSDGWTDDEVYEVFNEGPEYDFAPTHLQQVQGMNAVRQLVKKTLLSGAKKSDWAHAYCERSRKVVTFHIQNGKFIATYSDADANYLKAFEAFRA